MRLSEFASMLATSVIDFWCRKSTKTQPNNQPVSVVPQGFQGYRRIYVQVKLYLPSMGDFAHGSTASLTQRAQLVDERRSVELARDIVGDSQIKVSSD